jgi:hypothetical protein
VQQKPEQHAEAPQGIKMVNARLRACHADLLGHGAALLQPRNFG